MLSFEILIQTSILLPWFVQLTATTTTHFQNVQNANSFLNKKDFLTLRGPTDRTRWNTYPSIVNAFYEPQLNSISMNTLLSPNY